MEPKKNSQLELTEKRPMYFNLALMMSISIVLFAFEWKSSKVTRSPFSAIEIELWNDLPDIPITIQQSPPPPTIAPIVIQVPDNEIVDIDVPLIDLNIDDTPPTDILSMSTPPVIEKADEVLDFTEVMPQPNGGMEAWQNYLYKNLKYPTQAKRMGVEGTVYISFIVNKDGGITNVEILRGIGAGCDEEAIRVISNAPKWLPGKQGAKPVRVKMRLPIKFKLQ